MESVPQSPTRRKKTTAITNIRWCTVTFETHILYLYENLLIVTYVNS